MDLWWRWQSYTALQGHRRPWIQGLSLCERVSSVVNSVWKERIISPFTQYVAVQQLICEHITYRLCIVIPLVHETTVHHVSTNIWPPLQTFRPVQTSQYSLLWTAHNSAEVWQTFFSHLEHSYMKFGIYQTLTHSNENWKRFLFEHAFTAQWWLPHCFDVSVR